jgi:hypothetical protein
MSFISSKILSGNRPRTIIAFGGTVTDINVAGIQFRVHKFTENGEFIVRDSGINTGIQYLVVARGGNGGSGGSTTISGQTTRRAGGGGGGGGVRRFTGSPYIPINVGVHNIIVGTSSVAGNSLIPVTLTGTVISATKGGDGGSNGGNGGNGGSGGGGSGTRNMSTNQTVIGSGGSGNLGGFDPSEGSNGEAGGSSPTGGNGGSLGTNGFRSSIEGDQNSYSNAGFGGGSGNGLRVLNPGSGGGGGGFSSNVPTTGVNGVVIIRYPLI